MNILETNRLYLREMTLTDMSELEEMLCDDVVMYAYMGAFSKTEAREWLDRQIARYKENGFGLWAVIQKSTGRLIGQCGLTVQDVEGRKVTEIGYIFNKNFWGNGYATEAAAGCKKYAFDKLKVAEVFSIIRDNNVSSIRVAQRNGMHEVGKFVKHYKGVDMPHIIFCIKNNNIMA